MPELPEVECLRRSLEPQVLGKTLRKLEVSDLAPFDKNSLYSLNDLVGKKIKTLSRRAKYLLWYFDELCLLNHLGMTGQWLFYKSELQAVSTKRGAGGYSIQTETAEADKHCHLKLYFSDGDVLYYRDTRRFGYLGLCSVDTLEQQERLEKLGPDAWPKLELPKVILTKMKQSRSPIKSILLSQKYLAGLGNIYVDEVLFLSRIHPLNPAYTLSEKNWKSLLKVIPEVLEKGVQNFGTTLRDFKLSDGRSGNNQEGLQVYGRSGMPCLRCQNLLENCTIAGRRSVFCQSCQPIYGGLSAR